MTNKHTPKKFGIASRSWTGLAKLGEEANEVGQEIFKIIATGGSMEYGDGTGLTENLLLDEIGDLLAAIEYVLTKNKMPLAHILKRKNLKLKRYEDWFINES